MSFALLIIGKALDNLTFEDIEEYFLTPRVESDKIEFKSYAPDLGPGTRKSHRDKENGVMKAICAMLNSAGGLIIWGAPEGKSIVGQREKVFQGALSPVNQLIEKDSFISSISDRITPTPSEVRFRCLEKNAAFLYLIEVNQSPYSPHQFQDTYYMRLDGQSRPAPHHFIEALFRKVTYPNLEGYLRITGIASKIVNHFIITEVELSIFIFNLSELQNEHDVYIRVEAPIGSFSHSLEDISREYVVDRTCAIVNAQPTLYFKAPFIKTVTLYVLESSLIRVEHHLQLDLFFGGRQSPLKMSRYTFDLQAEEVCGIVSKKENQLLSEPNGQFDSARDHVRFVLNARGGPVW